GLRPQPLRVRVGLGVGPRVDLPLRRNERNADQGRGGGGKIRLSQRERFLLRYASPRHRSAPRRLLRRRQLHVRAWRTGLNRDRLRQRPERNLSLRPTHLRASRRILKSQRRRRDRNPPEWEILVHLQSRTR